MKIKLPRSPARMTPGFAFSFIERCINESLAERKFGIEEKTAIVEELFDGEPECIDCGTSDFARWDHLYPIAEGGDTVIGNMVLACSRCDDSKQALPYEEWMLSDARFFPKTRGVTDLGDRLKRIREYVAAHQYLPKPIEDRLTPEELNRLKAIRQAASSLCSDLESLIEDVRSRRELT